LSLSASGEETTPESWRIIRAAGPDLPMIGRLQTRAACQIEGTAWSVGCETLDRDYSVYVARVLPATQRQHARSSPW